MRSNETTPALEHEARLIIADAVMNINHFGVISDAIWPTRIQNAAGKRGQLKKIIKVLQALTLGCLLVFSVSCRVSSNVPLAWKLRDVCTQP